MIAWNLRALGWQKVRGSSGGRRLGSAGAASRSLQSSDPSSRPRRSRSPLPLDLLMFQRGQPRAQSCRTLRRLISFEDQGPSTQQDLKWAVITSQHRSFRQAAQALNIRQSTSIDISNSSKTVLAPSCSCAASSRDPMDRPRAGRGVSLWCRKRLCRPLQTASASRVRGRHRCVVASATRGIVCQFPRKRGSCLFEAAFRVRA